MRLSDSQLDQVTDLAIEEAESEVIEAGFRLAVTMYNKFIFEKGLIDEYIDFLDTDEKRFAAIIAAKVSTKAAQGEK